jgi:hypothetical protein
MRIQLAMIKPQRLFHYRGKATILGVPLSDRDEPSPADAAMAAPRSPGISSSFLLCKRLSRQETKP